MLQHPCYGPDCPRAGWQNALRDEKPGYGAKTYHTKTAHVPLSQSQSTINTKCIYFPCLNFLVPSSTLNFNSRPISTWCNGSNHKARGLVADGVIGFRQLHQPGPTKGVVSSHCPLNHKVGQKLPHRRRHTLSNDEKLEYINAELCLMKKPAKLGLPGAKTRFDELQAIHQLQAYATHFVVSDESHEMDRNQLLTFARGRFSPSTV